MSLVLSGAKLVTIAGSEMACLEIYTGEAYTLPFYFTDDSTPPLPVDCTDPTLWTLGMSSKWYTANVIYTEGDLINPSEEDILVENIQLITPQPSQNANLVAVFTDASLGEGYVYIPNDITGTTPETTPGIPANPTTLVIATLEITRQDLLSGLDDISREPIGLIVRYQ